MHILQIIHGYPPAYNAGSEVYTQTLCEALSKSHRVSIFTREEDPYRPDFDLRYVSSGSVMLYIINMPRGKDGFSHPELDMSFERLLKKLQPDIANIGHLNHLSTGLVDMLYKHRIPIVFTLHDFWLMCPRGQFLQVNFAQNHFYQLCNGQENKKCATNCYNRFFADSGSADEDLIFWTDWVSRRMETVQSLSQKIDHFIAPSRYLRQRFIDDFKIPEEKISYIDYGFDRERLNGRVRKPGEPFTFGYIGTHIPAKGINLLIEAFNYVKGETQLRIWGRPDGHGTHALRKMAAECPQPISFIGEYPNRNLVSEVLNYVDVVVVPSIWMENSPLVIHEAQGAHVPVITADAGGMAEYVQHEVNGLLFAHRDSLSLTRQMQYAVDHPEEMKVLGQRGYLYDSLGNVPDIGEHVKKILEVFNNIKQKWHHFSE